MSLHYLDDGAFTVDHLIPLAEGGDPESFENAYPAHRVCNLKKGKKLNYKVEKPKQSRIW